MSHLRRVSVRAEVRLEDAPARPAWLFAFGPGRVWLYLRESDAVAVRDGAAEAAEIVFRIAEADSGGWTEVSDLRLGAAHGGGDNALRRVLIAPARDSWRSTRDAPALRSAVVAVDHENALGICRSLPALRGVEVVHLGDVRESDTVGALLLGCAPEREPDVEAVRAAIRRLPGMRAVLFAKSGATSERWTGLVGSGDVFFASSGWPGSNRLTPLVLAALDNSVARYAFRELVRPPPETDDGFPAFAWYDPTLLRERRSVQEALRDLAARAQRRIPEITATVYAYDDWAEVLLGPHLLQQEDVADSAAQGHVAFSARTGTTVLEHRVADSALFDAETDLAAASGGELLAVPIRDATGTVFGVLACYPGDDHGHLRPELRLPAQQFASTCAAPLAALRESDRQQDDAGADPTVFRAEAIEEQRRSESPSAILNVSERWGSWIVGGMAALLLAFVAFLVFGTATEYAEGTAVVHSRGRVPVVANEGGTVAAIHITPQTEVAPGDVIGTLYDHAELAQVQRLEHEYEDALVRLLRNPEDPTAGSGLAALRGASEQARADLEERQLIVPVGGMLTDVRVRPGTLVNPGQTVATVRAARAGFEIVAAVPGNFRPLLASGLPVVAELEQFPGSRFHLEAREISPEVISPGEARALMGQLLPTGTEDGALALVYADLPEVLVSSTGAEHPLYDGMRGSVRIPVREERFIVTLWPALGRSR